MGTWKVIPNGGLYFVTTSIVDWESVFVAIPYFEILIDGLKFCLEHKGLHVHAYVVMPNHCHYILSTSGANSLSGVMRDYNTHTSRETTRQLREDGRVNLLERFRNAARADERGNEYKVWQDGFHPITLETSAFTMQKLNYLHENPVRKGFVTEPQHWCYSSARNYLCNDHSIIQVECLKF